MITGLAVLTATVTGCSDTDASATALPADFPHGVPISGTVLSAEKVDVGHQVWRVKVRGDDTTAAARALLDAGLKPVTDRTPMDAGKVGAVYRGPGVTVGLSSYDGEITYVIDPN